MKRLIQMFTSNSERCLDSDFEFDFRKNITPILKELNPLNPQNSITMFSKKLKSNSKDSNGEGLGLMRCLSVLHLIIMNSDEQYELVQGFLPLIEKQKAVKKKSTFSIASKKGDGGSCKFLKQNALYKYQKFLMKCIFSKEMYFQMKHVDQVCQIEYCSFELFFYGRNLLNLLLDSLQSLSSLARFFMESHTETIQMFGDVCAMQIICLYNAMVRILVGIIRNDTVCLKSEQDKQMIRIMVEHEMVEIDGEIKIILLNKYLDFVGIGMTVKYFKLEEQDSIIIQKLTAILSSRRNPIKRQIRRPRQFSENYPNRKSLQMWSPEIALNRQQMVRID